MPTTESDVRLEQIRQARGAMRAGPAALPRVRQQLPREQDWVLQSWQRCLEQGGEPDRSVDFEPVPGNRRGHVQDAHRQLLQVARPILQRLAQAVAPLRYFVLLTDAAGTVLETAGVDGSYNRHARALARVGVDLSEQSVGTTAISGALAEQAPVWLHRGEHFFRNVGVFSCAGAPLSDPSGRCVGMIDLTGVRVNECRGLKHLVAEYAQQVEEALLVTRPHALKLRISWPASEHVAHGHGLLCVDDEGCIVGSNGIARQMLPQLYHASPSGWHLKDFFALPWAELFDLSHARRTRNVPLWSGLRLQVSALEAGQEHDAVARGGPAHPHGTAARTLRAMEAEMIVRAVCEAGGRVEVAAQKLGVSRATVYRRLQERSRRSRKGG